MSDSPSKSPSTPPSPTQSFTLLKLPAEIRTQIYAPAIPVSRLCRCKHYLTNSMPRHFCLHCADRLGHDDPRIVSKSALRLPVNILRLLANLLWQSSP